MKLIVGLGNPGKEYEKTRHNTGFLAVDQLAKELDAKWNHEAKRKSLVAKCKIDGTVVLLAKPQTFMNASGEAVQALVSFYKIRPDDVLVIHDDMDLEPGRLKFTGHGSSAGHKGVTSIMDILGWKEAARLRLGIGHPDKESGQDWVLGKISKKTLKAIEAASEATTDWVAGGTAAAMTKWNRKE
jgi:PTH1 family peptidyl-tRNA hydrolase